MFLKIMLPKIDIFQTTLQRHNHWTAVARQVSRWAVFSFWVIAWRK